MKPRTCIALILSSEPQKAPPVLFNQVQLSTPPRTGTVRFSRKPDWRLLAITGSSPGSRLYVPLMTLCMDSSNLVA